MDRLEKGWRQVLSVTMLLIFTILMGHGSSSLQKVSAATPETGAFHLKKYVNVNEHKGAVGQKEAADDPSDILYGKETVAGVVYEIYRSHDYIDGKLVEIPSGPAAILDKAENYETDSNGEINIIDLPLGQYSFKEVSAPEGIQIDTEEYYFKLPYTVGDETELQYEVYVYPKNVRSVGSLSFTKVGDNGADGLKNVKFTVYRENGQAVKDADGKKLTVTTRLSGSAVIEDLQIGKYYLLETENPNTDYPKSSTTKYWFEIYSDNDEVKSRAFYTDAAMKNRVKAKDGKDLKEGIIINYKIQYKTTEPSTTKTGDQTKSTSGSLTKTGDRSNILLYILGLLSAGIITVGLIYRKRLYLSVRNR